MTATDIHDVVFKILGRIAPEADPDDLQPDENVREALDIDSFDYLSFIIALNEELGVDIPESDYGQLDTMDHIVNYLATRTG
jgi:acyl carrier protein